MNIKASFTLLLANPNACLAIASFCLCFSSTAAVAACALARIVVVVVIGSARRGGGRLAFVVVIKCNGDMLDGVVDDDDNVA
jgi:hypothetical protein